MMLRKLSSTNRPFSPMFMRVMIVVIVILCISSATGFCDEVPSETARQVAQGVLRHHVALFGHWNGSLTPTLGGSEIARYGNEAVAFNFQVQPSGHVLVIVEDELSPVPLYSTTSTFIPGRSDNPNAIESWIVPELKNRVRGARDFQRRAANNTAVGLQSAGRTRIKQAWAYFRGLSGDAGAAGSTRSLSPASSNIVRSATVGPLLTTAWGQGKGESHNGPYNMLTPDDDCSSGHTLTGCVATAWAQVLNYWQWPIQGQDSYTDEWIGDTRSESLFVDFNTTTYDWANMPAILTDSSPQVQKDAVSLLMYHLGVAADMDFGCASSGSDFYADEVLDTYFKYKTMDQINNRLERDAFTAAQWFDLFKAELDADPPRPVILSVFETDGGGHEVVVDGYQEGAANKVHINFGWEEFYDGYYDVTDDDDFNTAPYDWDVTTNQFIVVGIEPNNSPPSVDAGDPQSVEEETDVTLSGSATDPEGVGISSYLWTQVSGPAAVIANATTTAATITTPNVNSETQLVFKLRADDANRAYGTDTVTITVNNTDGSVAPPPPAVSSSGGGSSGGCFMDSLFNP